VTPWAYRIRNKAPSGTRTLDDWVVLSGSAAAESWLVDREGRELTIVSWDAADTAGRHAADTEYVAPSRHPICPDCGAWLPVNRRVECDDCGAEWRLVLERIASEPTDDNGPDHNDD